ncbi:exo-alpha-sialidase, partial [Trypanosoma cruzi]
DRILSVCASPPLCRAFAHVICYARACWGCFSGALGGHHLSMAVCVSEHVRMRFRAYGMKEWLEERRIQFGGYLDQIHLAAVDTCTTDVFPHNWGRMRQDFPKWPVNAIRVSWHWGTVVFLQWLVTASSRPVYLCCCCCSRRRRSAI